MCITSNFVVTQRKEESSPITVPSVREQMLNEGESDCPASKRLYISLEEKL
jgi:hypothetical protein